MVRTKGKAKPRTTTKTSAAIREYLAQIGRRGGQKKVPKGFSRLSPARRTEIAQKAAQARWAKERGEKQAAE